MKNKQQIRNSLTNAFNCDIIELLIKMPIYTLCQDELDKLKERGVEVYEQIEAWEKIDVTEQFIKELKTV